MQSAEFARRAEQQQQQQQKVLMYHLTNIYICHIIMYVICQNAESKVTTLSFAYGNGTRILGTN